MGGVVVVVVAHVIIVSAQVLWDFGLWDFGLGLDNLICRAFGSKK